ncbi:hypothetical protein [Brevibacillus agri]|uniref:hypothetical protein n=1 Tax=Brevibacillus agri TaxID=51101 RepID=UPI002867D0EC|nr:hypothetical protein [Brevibacillus agri]
MGEGMRRDGWSFLGYPLGVRLPGRYPKELSRISPLSSSGANVFVDGLQKARKKELVANTRKSIADAARPAFQLKAKTRLLSSSTSNQQPAQTPFI